MNDKLTQRCILCGNSNAEKYLRGLRKCDGCDLISADLDFEELAMDDIYQKKYFFGVDYVDYIREKKTLQHNFHARLKEIFEYIGVPENKNLFEVGCAYGFFLEVAKNHFGHVRGIDITREGCEYARKELGLDVIYGDFLKYDVESDRYDVFCLWDTIEHLKQPHLYIEKISKKIRKGGFICLTTGDIESVSARISREKWRMIHPPTHLFYFSRRTISTLLEKYGFRIEQIRYCGNYRTINSLFLNYQNSALYKVIKNSRFLNIPTYCNLFDIMTVIAKKI